MVLLANGNIIWKIFYNCKVDWFQYSKLHVNLLLTNCTTDDILAHSNLIYLFMLIILIIT